MLFGGPYTTDFSKHGDIIPSVHRLRIPDDATKHRYRLTLSMHPFENEEWLPVLNEQGQVTGDIVILTLIPVVEEWELGAPGAPPRPHTFPRGLVS